MHASSLSCAPVRPDTVSCGPCHCSTQMGGRFLYASAIRLAVLKVVVSLSVRSEPTSGLLALAPLQLHASWLRGHAAGCCRHAGPLLLGG
jgi:hypothetical protein